MTTYTLTPKTTRRQMEAEVARLTYQLESAKAVVDLFAARYEAGDQGVVEDALGTAWNAAHDAVTALECEIRMTEQAWSARKNDPTLAALVAANID